MSNLRHSLLSLLVVTLVLISCTSTTQKKNDLPIDNKAEALIEAAYKNHGGELYESAQYSFVFRDKKYTFKNDGENYEYRRKFQKKGHTVEDIYKNGEFARMVDDKEHEINEEKKNKFSNALNSVIYFATLPHKLNDNAVVKTYEGTEIINTLQYEVVKVTFKQEGGGDDFQDEYRYWINASTNKIDYLAYNYQVDGSGVRYRIAYNPRVVNGIIFQDYINFAAPSDVALENLPKMHAQGELEEISRIELKEIVDLKNGSQQEEG